MDAQSIALPGTTPVAPAPSEPGLLATWPRCAQLTLGALLGLVLLVLGSQALLSSWHAPSEARVPDRVDLNRASQAELVLLPGIGPSLAERILDYRQEKGPFKKVDDLRRVSGIGPITLERLRLLVHVSENAAPQPRAVANKLSVIAEPAAAAPAKKGAGLTTPIDLNSASLADLQQLPGIGPKLSQRIVDERAKKPFQSVDELRRVHGIGKKTVDKVRPFARAASTVIAANP